MNEIERVVRALDVLEELQSIDEVTMIEGINPEHEVFIIDTDVEKMKEFLEKALELLNDENIEIRREE